MKRKKEDGGEDEEEDGDEDGDGSDGEGGDAGDWGNNTCKILCFFLFVTLSSVYLEIAARRSLSMGKILLTLWQGL